MHRYADYFLKRCICRRTDSPISVITQQSQTVDEIGLLTIAVVSFLN